MTSSPQKRLPVSPMLDLRRHDGNDLFLQFEEQQAFDHFRAALNLAMGTYLSGAVTLEAREARLRGIARGCADGLVHRALSGKTRARGLPSIAAIQVVFDDEVSALFDIYDKTSGGSRGA